DRFPTYDVTVNVQAGTAQSNGQYPPIPGGTGLRFGTITENIQWEGIPTLGFGPPRAEDTAFKRRVEFAARNGVMVQYITATPVEGEWRTKNRLMWNDKVPVTSHYIPADEVDTP